MSRLRTPTRHGPQRPPAAAVDDAAPVEVSPAVAKGTRDDLAQRAREAQGNVDERTTLIAHDVRTPLSIIMLEAELLEQNPMLAELSAVRRSLERIVQNASYVNRLVGDILDLASVDAGTLQLRLQELDLGQLVASTIERAVSSVDRNRVVVQIKEPATVNADANRLERVLANFVSNALKYSTTPVTIVLDRVQQRARVSVADRGAGLTPEQARNVFDRYRRMPGAERHDGHGLGLFISRRIVDAHRGRIGVISSPGQGSRFFFELPIVG
ncbi:MAG: HAMP domain-containing histidine kinase [Deltaproteobacteria bacterium]|nr:HAMP domain-containing histidine kinase [Deltaproteobacteria bacterium]MDQ3296002.1 HAMP domain-containing histidine kinase [Myxococcota bacterium]